MSTIEALYLFDEHNNLLLNHTYTARPSAPATVLSLYLQHPSPRPSLIYLSSLSPPTLCYSIIQDNVLFLSPCASPAEPLLVLEFLHRVADALQEFLGSPLIATRITASYDVVAQILAEMADGGVVCQGEANALKDVVETGPGVLKNLLGTLGASGSSPALSSGPAAAVFRPQLQQAQSSQGSAIAWRRSNVRHTSNELYVDLVESLAITMAPSGRPISAFAYGSIAFNCKVSGVPDLVLNLSTGGKGGGMGSKADHLSRIMERVVFHPCVRLNRWKSDGVLSFIPPDGRFAICGYEVDLIGADAPLTLAQSSNNSLDLPATIEVSTGLGLNGMDFEVRVSQPPTSSAKSAAAASLQSNLGGRTGKAAASGEPKTSNLNDLVVHIPVPAGVRNVSDLRASKGESHWSAADATVEWKIPAKDFGALGATLRCTVQGHALDTDEDVNGMTSTTYGYDDEEPSTKTNGETAGKTERNRALMPTSATLSFSVKGWLASGLKVESLLVDTKKSRGLGPEVKPYKGVKYVTVSRKGVEVRC